MSNGQLIYGISFLTLAIIGFFIPWEKKEGPQELKVEQAGAARYAFKAIGGLLFILSLIPSHGLFVERLVLGAMGASLFVWSRPIWKAAYVQGSAQYKIKRLFIQIGLALGGLILIIGYLFPSVISITRIDK